MSDITFQRFIDFVEQDQKIDQLLKEKKDIKERLIHIEKEIGAINAQLAESAQSVHDLKKKLDLAELDLKTLSQAIKDKQFKLNQASSPKQFFSLEHELKELEAQRTSVEEQGFVLLSSLEDAQKNNVLLKEVSQQKMSELEKEQEERNTRLFYIDKINEAYQKEQAEVRTTLSEDMLSKYEYLRARDPKPIVPLLKGSCSACFYSVSQPDLVEAQKHKLVTCKDCYRMLYIYPEINHYNQDSEHKD